MPKLLPNLERLCFCQFRKGEEDNYNFLNQLQYMIMIWKLQLSHDYSAAEILVWDFKYLSFKHILRLDINLMQKALSILQRQSRIGCLLARTKLTDSVEKKYPLDMSKIKELLRVSDEEARRVRKLYKKTEEEIEDDVNILLDWLKKQPHLPKSHDRDRLERFLMRNKFRIERTKIKLDNYYAFKVLYPEFYPPHLNPESDVIKAVKKSLIIVPMPKLLPYLERLHFFKFVEGQDQHYSFLHQVQYMIMLWELQLAHDYGSTEILVFDLRHMTFKHVLKFDLNLMQKGLTIFRHAFSARVARVIYINVGSSVFDVLLGILKRVTDSKLFAKIQILKDAKALHEFIPREYLPEEVGGTAGSVKDLCDEWDEEMIQQGKFLELQASRVSDERLRVGEPLQDDLFGIEGTFKKINLD